MRKDRIDPKQSPLAALNAEQRGELFAYLQDHPHFEAVEWCRTKWNIEVSLMSLSRFFHREHRRAEKAALINSIRQGLEDSRQYDKIADERVLDVRLRKALKLGFFALRAALPREALGFASAALEADKVALNETRMQRLLAAERQRDHFQEELEKFKALLDAAKRDQAITPVDSQAIMDEVNKLLGRKP